MEINAYIKPLLRWWRLIAIVTVLALAASAVSTLFQPDTYISRTTLMIGSAILNANPDSGQLYIAQQLAVVYADMARREPIQNATMEALGITWLPQYQARVVPNAQLIEISVTDTNPERAQIIANELARQLILQSPAISESTEPGDRQEFIRQQLSSLQAQIEETTRKIEELQTSLIGLNSASQIQKIEGEIEDLSDKLNTLRESYANFLSNSQQGALNILSVIEPANLPTQSVNTNKYLIIFLAGFVGFTLGCGAAYVLEYLDRTIKTTSDVERVFNLPVIGYISEIADEIGNATYVARKPDSILAENFRLLRSNIEFFQVSRPLKTILITSPSQGNGKTTVASNLALSLAQGEQEVILVDADLRRPAVHNALKMTREPGLTDAIKNKAEIKTVIRKPQNHNINVITVGSAPPNITEVLGSKRVSSILSQLTDSFEMVVVDAPPLIISDAFNLAAKVDGVILVMIPGETTVDQAKAIKEQLDRAEAKVLGIVLNKLSGQTEHSYSDYRYEALYAPKYYGDYVSGSSDRQSQPAARSKKLMAFFEHGEVPSDVALEVENAITAIKTQPRNLVNKIRKPKSRKRENSNSNSGAG
jgi:capsular exopolysaccharide synthesis family protein